MGEFIFLDEPAKSVQKKLNQWKHNYKIEIVTSNIYQSIGVIPFTMLAIMIYRTPVVSN
jgi:hypothetical protein